MTIALLLPQGRQRYYGNDGLPLAGGKLYTYAAGTSTPKAAYTDADALQPHTNPIILDAKGEAVIYWDGAYKVDLKASDDTQVTGWPVDDIQTDPLGLAGALAAFIAQLATTVGASLIGFIQSGVGAIAGTVQGELRRHVWAEQFGAVGDGATDSTTFVLNAKNRVAAGGVLEFGPGTFIIGSDAALTLSSQNITLRGQRGATVLKAKNGANLTSWVALAADGCTVENLIIDGNRANGGTADGFYNVYITASNSLVRNCEIRYSTFAGVFIGSGTANPRDVKIDECWIHHNGGLSSNTGDGVGIYGGGSFPVNGLTITNSRFEENFNNVAGFPGDSTAMNIIGMNITVDHCYLENNHNVQGGQLTLTSNGVDGSADGRFIVSNCQVMHTVAFSGENTTGIEIEGRKILVHDNIVRSLNGDGVRLETSGGEGIVHDNDIMCTNNGVNLITVGGTGVRKVHIHHNEILVAGTGISIQAGVETTGIIVTDNYFDPSIPTKIAGAGNAQLIRGNINYVPANQTNLTAGASPYTYPILNYDAVYSCAAVNGMFSAAANGINFSILGRIPILVKAGQQFTVAWATTAPVFDISAAQGG